MSAEEASDSILDDRLKFRGQRIILRLVENDLEALGRLMIALQHIVLGHVGKSQKLVGGWIVELGSVKQAAIHGRNDFATTHDGDRRTHLLEEIGRKSHGAVFDALEIMQPRSLLS